MLSISSRTARLNQDHRGKSKEKNGEVTKLLHFGVDEVELSEEELAAMTGEKYAARSLINTTKNGKSPALPCFKAFELATKFDVENAAVTVRLRGGEEYRLTDCAITKQRVKVDDAGTILYSCKVRCAPPMDARYAALIANFGELADFAANGAQATDQKDLPLNKHGTGEQAEAGEKPKRRSRKSNGEGARVN